MVVVQLIDNGFPSMVLQAKTPRDLKAIFNLAGVEKYTVNIVEGWDYAWVQTAWLNWQEELVPEFFEMVPDLVLAA